MSELAEALATRTGEPVAIVDSCKIDATQVLELAGQLESSLPSRAPRVLSLDPNPATLIALLIATERRGLQLILGRPSMDMRALGETLEADVVVEGPERLTIASVTMKSTPEPGVLLLTSGTTGTPKVAHQTLSSLLGRVKTAAIEKNLGARWLLTYESHSFAGLQVVLSSVASRGTLIAPADRGLASLISAARTHEATHVSGTPTFWRALLLALGPDGLPSLRQITLGGEAVDQAILDRLKATFPAARRSHIYASTEAGSLFAVHDGLAGFPAAWLEEELPGGIRLRIREDALEVKSPRQMRGYVSGQPTPLTEDGWLITGDLVRTEGDRVLFQGRTDHIVNVGGLKVSPEEVEAFLLAQPGIAEAHVYALPSPLTGALLAAKVVLLDGAEPDRTLKDLRAVCTQNLPPHKTPRRFEITDSIPVASSGKKAKIS
jgi:acyl-CoA synthetase (AMP-forming)/AMP-acid ligase II